VSQAALPHPAGILFDCDGVLVDSERITNGVWARLLTGIGLPMTTEQSLAIFMGNSMPRCVAIVEERLGRPAPADLLPRFYEESAAALARDITAVPGIVALLDALDARGVPYAVASNGEHAKMQVTLGATGLWARFEGRRFSATEVPRPKPAPDLFLHAAATMGFPPARTIVVEDSALGVEGATAAGMTVIGYAELVPPARLRAAGAVATVHAMEEVLPLLLPLLPPLLPPASVA
jgi:HAD superfamily hydrolase (TIGR01509 family)